MMTEGTKAFAFSKVKDYVAKLLKNSDLTSLYVKYAVTLQVTFALYKTAPEFILA